MSSSAILGFRRWLHFQNESWKIRVSGHADWATLDDDTHAAGTIRIEGAAIRHGFHIAAKDHAAGKRSKGHEM